MSVTVYEEKGEKGHSGELVILRDITHEKRMTRNNEALLRISLALPAYPILEDLMDYISQEVKSLLNTEGALVILHDPEKDEVFFQGAAYDDKTAQKRVKKIRFSSKKSVSGRVIRSGKPLIIHDTSQEVDFNRIVDEQLNMYTDNMLIVPIGSGDRSIGVLMALNKKKGHFEDPDIELLNLIAGTVALSIENAQYSKEIQRAYQEMSSLNRAKDRAINHLSHEIKTPISILLASLDILKKKIAVFPREGWAPTLDRAKRNLDRILDIQYEVEDIMQEKDYRAYHLLTTLLDQCTDELEVLVAQEVGESPVIKKIRDRIEDQFGPKQSERSEIGLEQFITERLEALKPQFSHRQVVIETRLESAPSVCLPPEVLRKTIDGIIRNAIENTPDGGKIEIMLQKRGEGAQLEFHDFGVGIEADDQVRIFEGFVSTQETMDYSSKHPYDFNAGGKGADLLRMKIFSERYHFKIDMESTRCGFLKDGHYRCPGKIQACRFCKKNEDCYASGETTFTLFFPSTEENDSIC
jgi:signal transduction histidine kinase